MILVNGKSTHTLPVTDRGLQYGDGAWETIAIKNGQPLLLEAHLTRLRKGLEALGITHLDSELLAQEIKQIISSPSMLNHSVLKIIITRGSGGRGYNPQGCTEPTRILSLHRWPNYPKSYSEEGVDLTLCKTRLSHNPQLAGFKHLNRLEQVLARAEFNTEFQEGLVRDISGNVIEATMSNLFVMNQDDSISTPNLTQCGIEGIARAKIISELDKMGVSVMITQLSVENVLKAKALFLSNSIINIWPVKVFQDVSYEIPKIVRELETSLLIRCDSK